MRALARRRRGGGAANKSFCRSRRSPPSAGIRQRPYPPCVANKSFCRSRRSPPSAGIRQRPYPPCAANKSFCRSRRSPPSAGIRQRPYPPCPRYTNLLVIALSTACTQLPSPPAAGPWNPNTNPYPRPAAPDCDDADDGVLGRGTGRLANRPLCLTSLLGCVFFAGRCALRCLLPAAAAAHARGRAEAAGHVALGEHRIEFQGAC
jgi:hypothetical protein